MAAGLISNRLPRLLGGYRPPCRSARRCASVDPTMSRSSNRRQFLVGTFGIMACSPPRLAAPTAHPTRAPRSVAEIEASVGGRVGVFAVDTGTDRQLAHRADELFAMCSTFKWVLAAAILLGVDRAQLSLDDRISYGPSDVLEYAPVVREHVAEGSPRCWLISISSETAVPGSARRQSVKWARRLNDLARPADAFRGPERGRTGDDYRSAD